MLVSETLRYRTHFSDTKVAQSCTRDVGYILRSVSFESEAVMTLWFLGRGQSLDTLSPDVGWLGLLSDGGNVAVGSKQLADTAITSRPQPIC